MKSKITLLALALVFIYSCKAKKEVAEYKPLPSSEEKVEVVTVAVVEDDPAILSPVEENTETIALAATYDGRSLYENSCAHCHVLFQPMDHSKESWVPIMKRMQKQARITDAETLAIYNYLTQAK